MKIQKQTIKEVDVRFLKVSAQVRYWGDAIINGERDKEGLNVPFKNGDMWEPVIDIEKGIVLDWPQGTTASFHFKVCDAGSYWLYERYNTIK